MFGVKPTSYISRISVPKSRTFLLRNVSGEQESLLLDEYSNKSEPIEEDSQSDNEENQIISGSDGEESTDSTDIDVVVQEYKEKLKVATITKFNEKIPSTIVTSVIVGFCTFIIILGSIGLSLILFNIYMFTWPSIIGKLNFIHFYFKKISV